MNRVGKMPVAIFELSFNDEMRKLIIGETLKYEKAQNDSTFGITDYDLKSCVGIMFLSQFHNNILIGKVAITLIGQQCINAYQQKQISIH